MEVNIREELMLLVDLQDIDDQLSELALDRGDLPIEVERLKGDIDKLNKSLDDLRTELEEVRHEVAHLRGVIEEARSKLEKYKQQLYAVKTTREYDAITTETDAVKKIISEGEERILELLIRENAVTSEIGAKETEFTDINEIFEAKNAELKAKLGETEQEELELRHARETTVMRIKKPIYAHYERIRLAKDGRGVARVMGGACGGCYAMVPPQRQVEIRNASDIVLCETCGRILIE